MNTQIAANDTTATTTLAIGETLETASWRIHRGACSISAIHLDNAGKRGKRCARIVLWSVLSNWDMSDAMSTAAESFCNVANRGGTVDEMVLIAEMCATARGDFGARVLDVHRSEERGIDVGRGADKIEITGERIRVRVERTEFCARCLVDKNNEPTVIAKKKSDAAKVYAWAVKNVAAIQAMSIMDFQVAIRDVGVTGHYYLAMD